MLGKFNNQKGFIGRKTLLLMTLIFSFFTFCLLRQLTPIINTIPNSKSKTTTNQTHKDCFGENKYEAYEFPKDKQASLSTNSNLDPRVVSRFSAPRQVLPERSPHEAGRTLDVNGIRTRRNVRDIIAIFNRHGWRWLGASDSPNPTPKFKNNSQ